MDCPGCGERFINVRSYQKHVKLEQQECMTADEMWTSRKFTRVWGQWIYRDPKAEGTTHQLPDLSPDVNQ